MASMPALNERADMSSKCFLYLIGSEGITPSCKIGIAKNPQQRLKTLQCGNPNLLWVSRAWEYQSRADAEDIERVMHESFSGYKMQGEWFSIDCDDAVIAMNSVFRNLHLSSGVNTFRADDLLDKILMGDICEPA